MPLKEGNRFFQPSVAQYTSQFVEEESMFPQMMAMGERDLAKRDFTQGKLDQISQYLKVNSAPSQDQYRNEFVSGFQERIVDLSEQMSSGKMSPDAVSGAITQLNADYQSSDRRIQLERGVEQAKAFETEKRRQVTAGSYRPYNNNFESQQESNRAGEFSELKYEGLAEFQDPQGSALQALGNIQPSSTMDGTFEIINGAVVSVHEGKSGIAANYLKEVAQQTSSAWLESIDGKSFVKEIYYTTPGLEELAAKDPEAASKYIQDYTTNYFMKLGAPQLHLREQDLKSVAFPSGAQNVDQPIDPAYDTRPDQYDFNTLDSDDLSTQVFEPGESSGIAALTGVGGHQIRVPVGYKELKSEDKAIYKNIIKTFDPQGKVMNDADLDAYLETPEARKIASDYLDKRGPVDYESVIDYTPYYDQRAKTDFHAQTEQRIKNESRGYRFMEARTGDIIESGTKGKKGKDKNKYENLMKLIKGDNLSLIGDEDYKNFHVIKSGDDDFSNAWRVKVSDGGKETEYIVSKPQSDQDEFQGRLYKNLNTLHTKTQQYPGIPVKHTILDEAGTEFTYDVTYNKDSGTWTYTDIDDPLITGRVKDLKHIVPAAQIQVQNLQQ